MNGVKVRRVGNSNVITVPRELERYGLVVGANVAFVPLRTPVSVPDKIRALLESHGLRQKDLVGPVFASESVVSDALHGRHRVTYEHVEKLASFFHASPAVFYP